MSNKEKIFCLSVLIGLILGICIMYLTLADKIYNIEFYSKQSTVDHRETICRNVKINNEVMLFCEPASEIFNQEEKL